MKKEPYASVARAKDENPRIAGVLTTRVVVETVQLLEDSREGLTIGQQIDREIEQSQKRGQEVLSVTFALPGPELASVLGEPVQETTAKVAY